MKLRELFENVYEIQDDSKPFDGGLKTVGVCFGRWNPPHKGHKAVWQAASANQFWYVGTNENTEGPKDPLPYEVKLQCMALVWPKVAKHVIPEQSLMTLASRIYEEHGENVHLKVYTDEEWLFKALSQYNGVEDKPHGFYKFSQIDWAKTQRLASATNLRAAVRAGDPNSFYKDAGVPPNSKITVGDKSYPMYELVAHYLLKYPEKAKVAEGSNQDKIAKPTKLSTKQLATTPNANLNGGDAYLNYRMNLALAGAPDYPTKAESEIGGDPLYSAYTDAEWEMIQIAAREAGAGPLKKLNRKRSEEMPDVNKTSAVAKIKRNKYGV